MAVQLTPPQARGGFVARRKALSPTVREAFGRAASVTEAEVDAFAPNSDTHEVALAILGGATSTPDIRAASGLSLQAVTRVLADGVAMAWCSRSVAAHFRHRAAFVDSALYTRALTGDVAAIKLFFERHRILVDEKRISVQYGGSVELKSVSTDELARIVQDRARLLPAEFKVVSDGGAKVLQPGDPCSPKSTVALSESGKTADSETAPGGEKRETP